MRGYKFNSLLLKNFAYVFILVTLPLLLVLSLNYNKFSEAIGNRVMSMNEELLQQSAVVTDNIMVGLLDNLNLASQQNLVMECVQMKDAGDAYNEKAKEVIAFLQNHVSTSELITSAYIYSDVNEMLISTTGAEHARFVSNKGKWYNIHLQSPMVVPYIVVNESGSIYICQPIWSAKGQRSGLFILDVDLKKIGDVLESQEAAQRGVFFVLDMSGQTIYCNEQGTGKWNADRQLMYEKNITQVRTGQSQLTGEYGQQVVSVMESTHKSLRYAFVTELPDYQEETKVLRGFLISSVVVGIATSIIVAFVITVLTFRPVRKIISVIQNPQLHWNEKEATKQSNELLFITSNILAERDDNKEISEELEDRVRALRQAQFRALQFQIDPHFLYNTLETIKWNAVEEMGLGNKTSKMLTKVARLYRLGLENDDVIVPLKEELEFLKLYIEIVQIRFGDAISFHWDIEEGLQDCSMIKMCLQPVVENAIQHGLRFNKYQGNITISARYQEDCLHIFVDNDGQPMNRWEMERLNAKLKTGEGFETSKVGLRNVNERIKLIYGKKYGVSIQRIPAKQDSDNENVRVVLTFPFRNYNRSEESK
ncbi:MAG: histidine kinase [Oscillospiraceae bacterium]|nr:histidine kinase [Oscillospiraceae bacterium]